LSSENTEIKYSVSETVYFRPHIQGGEAPLSLTLEIEQLLISGAILINVS